MATLNRIVTAILWLALLALLFYIAIVPLMAVAQAQSLLIDAERLLLQWRQDVPANFLIGQITVGVVAVLFFGVLFALEVWPRRRRGVRIRTVEGGLAELDTTSIGRRLEWHLDQLAEVVSVAPVIKSKGGAVDIRLDIETAPDVDVPMKTDEVVEMTRDIIEHDMGLKLGKLDVRMRYAPFDPEWVR